MNTLLYLKRDKDVQYGTCATRTDVSREGEDRGTSWRRWESEGWVQTGDGRHLCPLHSGRRR